MGKFRYFNKKTINRRKYFSLVLIVCISHSFLFAQQVRIDSLVSSLNNIKNLGYGAEIAILNDIAYSYLFINPDSTIYYSKKAENLSKKTGNIKEQALSRNLAGLGQWAKGNLSKALQHYEESIALSRKIQDENMIARNIGNIGLIYHDIGKFKQALEYYERALNIFQKLKNYERIAVTLNVISKTYLGLYEYEKAANYSKKALPLMEKYRPNYLAVVWKNLSEVDFSKKQYDIALKGLDKALFFAEKYEDQQDLTNTYQLIAKVYLAKGDINRSYENALKGVLIAEKSKRKVEMYMAYDIFSKILEIKGDLTNALKFKKLYITYQDSVRSLTNHNSLKIFEYEKAQHEIELLKARQLQKDAKYEKQLIWQRSLIFTFLSAFTVMIFITIFFSYNRNKIQKINTKLQSAYKQIQEKQTEIMIQNQELQFQKEEIENFNGQLETLVEERTDRLVKINQTLTEYAFFNAHKLRSPIATILGLYEILKLNPSHEEKEMLIENLKTSIIQLDLMVRESQSLLDEVED